VFQFALNGRRLYRANFFDVQGVGRIEDCEKGPEPDGGMDVGARDHLPESRPELEARTGIAAPSRTLQNEMAQFNRMLGSEA
jgi:hypothetical protein